MNVPNPFKNFTQFYFTLTADSEVELEIFTLSGRKIFKAKFPGYKLENWYDWNGRDNEGDKIAKGVYLYKLTATNSISGKSTSKIEKLVKK